MHRLMLVGILSVVVMLAATVSSAFAKREPAIKSGTCSAASDWKLKAKADDGRLETEFEVDQNRVGRRWRVTLRLDGSIVFRGIRTTAARSGSFTVRRLLAARAGRIVATATALQGGETCRATLSL